MILSAKVLKAELLGLASGRLSRRTPVRLLLPQALAMSLQTCESFVHPPVDGGPAPDEDISTRSGKVEVVASRRQQKQAQAAAAMPPPPAKPGKQPAASASGFPAPAWAGTPPAGCHLEVQKNGEAVQQIELSNPCTLFGRLHMKATFLQASHVLLVAHFTCVKCRSTNADVVLDHASTSRQHATVCYRPDSSKWFVTDQGSAHGTFVNGKQAVKVKVTCYSATPGPSAAPYCDIQHKHVTGSPYGDHNRCWQSVVWSFHKAVFVESQ